MGSVLLSQVTVEAQSIGDLFFLDGLFASVFYQANRVVFPQLVSNNETIKQILDCRSISPCLLGSDIGDVGNPFLRGRCGREITVQNVVIAMIDLQLAHLLVRLAFTGNGADIHLLHEA